MDLDTLLRWLVIIQFTALAGIRLHFKWVTGTMAAPPLVRAEGWFTVLLRLGLTLALLVLVGLYSAGRPEADLFGVRLPTWLRLAGVPLGLSALGLLVAAHRSLGAYFSPTLRLRADHRLVNTGPYRFIRHPIYGAYLLFFIAAGLLSANLGIGGIGIAVIGILVTLRLPREERLLADRFGQDWERYAATTGRFLPGRNSLPGSGPRPGEVSAREASEALADGRPGPFLIGRARPPVAREGMSPGVPESDAGEAGPCRATAR